MFTENRPYRVAYRPSETQEPSAIFEARSTTDAFKIAAKRFPNSISRMMCIIELTPGDIFSGRHTVAGNPNYDSEKARRYDLRQTIAECQRELGNDPRGDETPPDLETGRNVKSKEDALKILEITEPFDRARLAAAFRDAMKQNHPDRVASMSPVFRQLAERRTKEINAAMNFLRKHL